MKRILKACVTFFTLALFLLLLFSCNTQAKSYKIIFYIDNQEFLVKEFSEKQTLELPTPPEVQNKSFEYWGYKINGTFYEIEPLNLNSYANSNNIIELFAVYATDEEISTDKPNIKIEVKLINTLDETYISLNYNKGYLFNPPKLNDTEEYEFDGWYYDYDYKLLYTAKELSEDTVLYSKFTVKITHIFSDWKILTEPSCNSEGKKERNCQDCLKTEVVILPKLKHIFNKTTESATCEKGGCDRFLCELCNFEYLDNIIKPLGHSYGEFLTFKEANCVENGEKVANCHNCDMTKSVTIEKIPHKYSVETFKPTCINEGYKLHKCTACADFYTSDISVALGHSMSDFITEKLPSCIESGFAVSNCINCSFSEEKVLSATDHSMTEFITDSHPNCINKGLSISSCKKCDFKTEKILEPLGHAYQSEVILPTCENQGFTEYCCTRCNETFKEDIKNSLGHIYNNGEITVTPTCFSVGEIKFNCIRNNCKHYKLDIIDKLNHNYTETIIKPTCTEKGYSEFNCLVCSDYFVAKETAITEHIYVTDLILPTCVSQGYTNYCCKNCNNEYKSDYVDMTEHEYENTVITPTCDNIGYTLHTCKKCLDTYKDNYLEASHDFEITIIEPTCQNEGYTVKQCKKCDNFIKTDIVILEHNIFTVITESSCILKGFITERCHNCEHNKILEYLPLSDHKMGEWIELADKYHSECLNCEYYEEKIKEKTELIYYYDALTDYYHVNGATNENVTEIEIPDFYKGKKVTEIKSNAFKNFKNLSYVLIKHNVNKIGDFAFANCDNLRAVILPSSIDNKSLSSVSVSAFANCPKLTLISANVPTVAFPEPRWFSETFKLYLNSEYSGNIHQNINKNNYFYENGFHYLIKDNTASVIKYSGSAENIVFKNFIDFNNKKIPVIEVGEYSFIYNDTIKSVTLNENIKTIRISAFKSCSNLQEIFIGANVTAVSKFAFRFCPYLKIYLNQPEIPKGFNIYWKDTDTEVLLNSPPIR